jgi:opacity protein-like surface antigen
VTPAKTRMPAIVEAMLLRGLVMFVRIGSRALSATVFVLAVSASSGAMAQNCGPLLANGIIINGGAGNSQDWKSAFGAGIAGASAVAATINATNTAFLTHGTAFVSAPGNAPPDSQGGGVWIRGVGGESTTKSSGTTSYNLATTQVVPPNNGSTNCSSAFKQNFAGVQVGQDIARLNVGGWNIHFGGTAGYMGSNGSVNEGATPTGGSFASTTQAPFVGTYAAATKGGFFIDGLLRANYYETSLNSPSVNIYNQKLDAHGVSASGSVGYHAALPNSNWFVEPSASLIWSRVSVDPLQLAGAGVGGISGYQGSTQINDISSTIGRAGLRVGTTLDAGNLVVQPFAAASVWRDFQGSWSANYASCTNCFFINNISSQLTASMSGSGVGTYGVYSIGASGQIKDTGWLGYVRLDRTAGANLDGWTGSGGIRYQFTPEAMRTAMITKAPVKAPALSGPVNWTGFYLGGTLGAGYAGRANETFAPAPAVPGVTLPFAGASATSQLAGILGGGQFGYNYQMGAWVLGAEAEFDWTNAKGSKACGNMAPANGDPTNALFNVTCSDQLNWLATATGRLGYAWDRTLFYAKAGAAWTHENFSVTCNQSAVGNVANVGSGQTCYNPAGVLLNRATVSDNRVGWTVGAGTEFALTEHWSARGEIDYLGFGSKSLTASDGTVLSTKLSLWESKVGVNYRFSSR